MRINAVAIDLALVVAAACARKPPHQAIDDHCGPDGVGSANSIAQNHAKNKFCAKAPATVVDVATLQTLQADVPALGIAFGSPQPSPCRHAG